MPDTFDFTIQRQEMTAEFRNLLNTKMKELMGGLQNGNILIPQQGDSPLNLAGGQSHCPNSDYSYSKSAAEVAGTLPGDAGDNNQEAWRWYWAEEGDDIVTDDAHTLKAVGHSLYAAGEGADATLPIWDRVNGWPKLGSTGTLHDIAVLLKNNIVGPSQKWFIVFKCASLDAAIVPDDVQISFGIWAVTGAGQGYISGDNFAIECEVVGTPGTNSSDYRVVAKTDSGLSMLSAVLNVPNAPDVLSMSDYVQVRFGTAGAGFIEFEIYRLRDGLYRRIFSVRNSNDLQYNDIGNVSIEIPAEGWPAVSDTAPLALARTRNFDIAAVGTAWKQNELVIQVPPTFDFSQVTSMYLRVSITSPTGVNRHIAIDQIVFDTTFHSWSPDVMPPFADGTYPIPTISPTSGNQGGTGGVGNPPPPGGGGCILTRVPVLTLRGSKRAWRKYSETLLTDRLRGPNRTPYQVLKKKDVGMVSEYYIIKTANGITLPCSTGHGLFLDLKTRKKVSAKNVKVGETRLACWVKGRNTKSVVVSKELIPEPAEVGTYVTRDLAGIDEDGQGLYIAGESKKMDRGVYNANSKPVDNPYEPPL